MFLLCWLALQSTIYAQTATVTGVVRGSDGNPIEGANIVVKENQNANTLSDSKGHYELVVESGRLQTVVFANISYSQANYTLIAKPGEKIELSPVMSFINTFTEVEITHDQSRFDGSFHLDPQRVYSKLPSVTGNFEDILKTMGGTSNNELSSGYSVRGGNYDENLVYVNDIEVYRPFLARSGQQEGLSFPNPAMVQNMNFYAGGFEARYGDKLSSVLDITYRKPNEFGGSASASLLGGNIQLEGVSKNHVVSWNVGARYRSNIYLLKTLDTQGEYKPSTGDFQSFFNFKINPKLNIEWLSSISANRYLVTPTYRQTDFGTVKSALRFTVYFDGQELMQYLTMVSGLSATYKPNSKTKLKFISSAYRTDEQEIYTLQGQYYIDQLEADLGKPNFGQVAYNRGVGTFLNNGRNYLNAMVVNFEHKGSYAINDKSEILWGVRQQFETINDKLSEWKTVDSSGFIVPYSPTSIDLTDVFKTKVGIQSGRSQAYTQYNFNHRFRDTSELHITAGVRANYWTFNEQTVVSPRVTFAWKPNWKRNWMFRFSSGIYYQPPFYRELRNIDGTINTNIKAQKSVHYVLSTDYVFKMWKRRFKFLMAAYYKDMTNIDPYEIDNVRIRYFANNNTKAYATGMDFRINGEFVKGAESWATLGILRTYEYSKNNIHYDYYNKDKELIIRGSTFDQVKADSVKVDPGYIPRPSNQLVTFGMFFQDYIPRYPKFKFNLNIQFGSGLPFGPPTHKRWDQVLKMPPYRRVDAGFAYNALKEDRIIVRKNVFNNLKELWVYLEVFNFLQVQNTVSYIWITDVTGNRYAIPNYLTNRQLNLRLQIKF